jgi:hypothetical protein
MHYMNIAKHRCMNYSSLKKSKHNFYALFNTFLLIPLRQKLQLRQGFKLFKMTKKDINIISNVFLDFFIRLT